MNRKQKTVLFVGVILFIVMGLFPPHSFFGGKDDVCVRFSRLYITNFNPPYYHFILSSPLALPQIATPRSPESQNWKIYSKIDFTVLIIQWIILSIIVFGILAIMKRPTEENQIEVSQKTAEKKE